MFGSMSSLIWQGTIIGVLYYIARRFFHFLTRHGAEAEVYGYVEKRLLSPSERALANLNHQVGSIRTTTVHFLNGKFSMAQIQAGLRVMQARYPIFRMGVHPSGSSELRYHEYKDFNRRIVLQVIPRVNHEQWREELQQQAYLGAYAPISNDLLLWRVVLLLDSRNTDSKTNQDKNKNNNNNNITNESQHELILCASHCCIDGTSAIMFGSILATYCEKLAAMVDTSPTDNRDLAFLAAAEKLSKEVYVAELRPSMEQLAKQHPDYRKSLTWMQMFVPSVPRAIVKLIREQVTLIPFKNVPVGQRRDHVDCCVLDAIYLQKLRDLCHEKSVTMHSALLGAAAKAYQLSYEIKEGRDIVLSSAVRTGNLFDIERSEMGVFISHFNQFAPAKSRGTDLWAYAKELHRELHVDPKTCLPGVGFRELEDSPGLAAVVSSPLVLRGMRKDPSAMRVWNVMVSNLGDMTPYISSPKDLWRGAFLAQDDRFLGGEFFVFVYSFSGQLYVTTTWTEPLMTRENGELFVKQLISILQNPLS